MAIIDVALLQNIKVKMVAVDSGLSAEQIAFFNSIVTNFKYDLKNKTCELEFADNEDGDGFEIAVYAIASGVTSLAVSPTDSLGVVKYTVTFATLAVTTHSHRPIEGHTSMHKLIMTFATAVKS